MQKINLKYNTGFTIIETLIALVIISLLSGIVSLSFSAFKNNATLEKNVADAKSILEEARSLSISDKADSTYSIHVQSNGLIRFNGSTYSASSSLNVPLYFTSATIDSISLNGGGSDIIFQKITGATDTYGTFRIKMTNDTTKNKTIRLTSTGVISEE